LSGRHHKIKNLASRGRVLRTARNPVYIFLSFTVSGDGVEQAFSGPKQGQDKRRLKAVFNDRENGNAFGRVV
jgi:hypothetical protein